MRYDVWRKRWPRRCAMLPTGVLPEFTRTFTARTQNALRTRHEIVRVCRGRQSAAQIGSVVDGYTACQAYLTMRFTVLRSMAGSGRNVKSAAAHKANLSNVTNATPGSRCGAHSSRVKLSAPWSRRLPDGRATPRWRVPGQRRDAGRAHAGAGSGYLTVTVAPAPSSAALALSADSLFTRSSTG